MRYGGGDPRVLGTDQQIRDEARREVFSVRPNYRTRAREDVSLFPALGS